MDFREAGKLEDYRTQKDELLDSGKRCDVMLVHLYMEEQERESERGSPESAGSGEIGSST